MSKIDYVKLSKMLAHALRHEPTSYKLMLDYEGWVLLKDVIRSLSAKGLEIEEQDIHEMITRSDKKRYQIVGGKIRAYYGHSTKEKILKPNAIPPEILYHGTVKANLNSILSKGIFPMNRQYVHLSVDEDTAKIVGRRKSGALVVVVVKAFEAYQNGIAFYKEDNGVWLADIIPSTYINI